MQPSSGVHRKIPTGDKKVSYANQPRFHQDLSSSDNDGLVNMTGHVLGNRAKVYALLGRFTEGLAALAEANKNNREYTPLL